MQKRREHTDDKAEKVEELPQPKKRDTSDIDALLDEIDEVLETADIAEAERKRSFREKLLSIGQIGRARVNCNDLITVPRHMAEHYANYHGADIYDGPPCVDC